MRTILKLESIKLNANKDAHTLLRQFINDFQNHIQCLSTLGQSVDAWNVSMLPILLNKLDEVTTQE